MIHKVNPALLSGYGTSKSIEDKTMSSNSGFNLFFKYPYVLGIFGMIFFWEIVNVIFNYMRLTIGLREAENISQFSAFLYKNAMLTQITGFIIVSLGTSAAVRYLGQRISLLLIHLFIVGLLEFQCGNITSFSDTTFTQRFRTDEVEVLWRDD